MQNKENDVRKQIALQWIERISEDTPAAGAIDLGSYSRIQSSPVSEESGSSIIWAAVGGKFNLVKPSEYSKNINLERLQALLKNSFSPVTNQIGQNDGRYSNNGGTKAIDEGQNNRVGSQMSLSTHKRLNTLNNSNLIKSLKFDIESFCQLTDREKQELLMIFKQLANQISPTVYSENFGIITSIIQSQILENYVDKISIEKFQEFLKQLSYQSKSLIKRILNICSLDSQGFLVWDQFSNGMRQLVCSRMLQSIDTLIMTIDKYKNSMLYWDDIWELTQRFLLFISRDYSLLEGSLMREICEYLTKQFFDYIGISSYRDGIPLIDVKEELLDGVLQKQLFYFAILSVRESDIQGYLT